MAHVIRTFSGRGAISDVRSAYGREIGHDSAHVVNTRTALTDSGRVIGYREGNGDTFELVEYTALEGLRMRLDFCEGKAADHEERAATWPEGHQLRAYNLRDANKWLAEADSVRGQIALVERLALGHLVMSTAGMKGAA